MTEFPSSQADWSQWRSCQNQGLQQMHICKEQNVFWKEVQSFSIESQHGDCSVFFSRAASRRFVLPQKHRHYCHEEGTKHFHPDKRLFRIWNFPTAQMGSDRSSLWWLFDFHVHTPSRTNQAESDLTTKDHLTLKGSSINPQSRNH